MKNFNYNYTYNLKLNPTLMKKILLTFSALLLYVQSVFALCACGCDDYAKVLNTFKKSGVEFIAAKGVIKRVTPDFIKIKVLILYSDSVSVPADSIITILNAQLLTAGYNGVPNSIIKPLIYKASSLGGLNDTLAFVFPKIDEKFYPNDIVGNYRVLADTTHNELIGYGDVGGTNCPNDFYVPQKGGIFKNYIANNINPFASPYVDMTESEFNKYIGYIITGLTQSSYDRTSFCLFPNPSENLLNFTTNKPCVGCKVEIIDSYSQSIFEKTYEDFSLDISNLKSGLYYFLLKDNNKTVGRNKFVKK